MKLNLPNSGLNSSIKRRKSWKFIPLPSVVSRTSYAWHRASLKTEERVRFLNMLPLLAIYIYIYKYRAQLHIKSYRQYTFSLLSSTLHDWSSYRWPLLVRDQGICMRYLLCTKTPLNFFFAASEKLLYITASICRENAMHCVSSDTVVVAMMAMMVNCFTPQ